MKAKLIQEEIFELLKKIFGDEKVEFEWDVGKESEDDFNRKLYCPKVDLAVRPFNIRRDERDRVLIEEILEERKQLIEKLKEFSYHINFKPGNNPRCFLAIEIEASGSRKYHLGDITNASILGSVGIVVTLDEEGKSKIYNGFKRTKDYLDFATTNRKIDSTLANNLLIIRSEDFLRILREIV